MRGLRRIPPNDRLRAGSMAGKCLGRLGFFNLERAESAALTIDKLWRFYLESGRIRLSFDPGE